MSTLKTVTLAAASIVGATSLAMAQNGMPPASYTGPGAYQSYKSEQFRAPQNSNTSTGNTGANAAASGGSGTHRHPAGRGR